MRPWHRLPLEARRQLSKTMREMLVARAHVLARISELEGKALLSPEETAELEGLRHSVKRNAQQVAEAHSFLASGWATKDTPS